MAWFRRRLLPGLIMHSDRGSQYCGKEWNVLPTQYAVRASMSRKGNCYESKHCFDAPTEGLWGRLKAARVHGNKYVTKDDCKQTVMNWFHFYNPKDKAVALL